MKSNNAVKKKKNKKKKGFLSKVKKYFTKRNLIIVLVAILVILAAGLLVNNYNNTKTKTVDGQDALASINDEYILADDLYTDFLATPTGESAVFDFVLQSVIDEYYPVDDDMTDYADEAIESIEASYEDSYGDEAEEQLLYALAYSGYSSMDEYREALIQSLQYSAMVQDYVEDNFDDVFADYLEEASPRYISIIMVSISDFDEITDDEQEALDEVEALLETSKDFGDIAASYSDDEDSADNDGDLGLVDTTSDLASDYGDEVEEVALSLSEGEVSEAVEGDDGYYFIYCYSTDEDTMKEELSSVDLESPLLAYDNYIVYDAFLTYDITYEDESIQEIVEEFINDAIETSESED